MERNLRYDSHRFNDEEQKKVRYTQRMPALLQSNWEFTGKRKLKLFSLQSQCPKLVCKSVRISIWMGWATKHCCPKNNKQNKHFSHKIRFKESKVKDNFEKMMQRGWGRGWFDLNEALLKIILNYKKRSRLEFSALHTRCDPFHESSPLLFHVLIVDVECQRPTE